MMNKKIKTYFLYFAISIISLNCSTLKQINLYPLSKDIALGKQFDAEIKKYPNDYPILKNHPDVKIYIENIGKKILASPLIKYKNQFAYQFEVIHDDSTVNAFCTPGGYIYVYTGLIKFLDNEAALAGIIAHEIAHAECRHSVKQMSQQQLLQGAIGLASSKLGDTGTKIAGVAAMFGMLTYSREHEDEADMLSFKYLQSTEYYPGAIKYFFEKVDNGKKSGKLEKTIKTALSTHPIPQDRLEHVNKLIKENGIGEPKEDNLFSERYTKFKNILPTK